jgi:hypothetical protein
MRSAARTAYLDRLRDLLPYRDGARILTEVEGLLEDRIEAERDAHGEREAERRALEALGPPESLAEGLTAPVRLDLATRRAFARLLAVTFAAHLVLSVVLTVAGGGRAIPGLLGPLPLEPLAAVFSGVLSLFLVDTGAVFLLFVLLGRWKGSAAMPALRLRETVRPRDAALGLVLLGLLGLILHPFRDAIFAVRTPRGMVPFLAPDLVALVPGATAVLGLFVLRQVLVLRAGGDSPGAVIVDAVACLVFAALLVLAATRAELVRLPSDALGEAAAHALSDLATRVLLFVFVVAALMLAVRFVQRLMRLREILLER